MKVSVWSIALGAGLLISTSQASAQSTGPIAGCTAGSFTDGAADNMIETAGTSYTPKCLKVKVGARVTIQATAHHPFSAMPDLDGVANPLASSPHAVAPVTQVFRQPGFYGYFCEAHGDAEGDGMAGVILVE